MRMDTVIAAALTATVALVAPAYADVDAFLKDYKLVKEYCYTAGGDCLAVGLITEPLFTLSGITAYTRELEGALADNFGYKEVVVTFDTDLVYRIRKLGNTADEAEVRQLIETARKRR